MIRPDGNKIQEIKDHFGLLVANECSSTLATLRKEEEDPERELTQHETDQIKQKHQYELTRTLFTVMMMQPEKMHKSGYGFNTEGVQGWRNGYTKPTIAKRKAQNRKTNKLARLARRAARKLQK